MFPGAGEGVEYTGRAFELVKIISQFL